MFKYKKTISFLILIVLAVGGYYYSKSKKPTVEYTTTVAQKGDLAQTVSVTGKIVAPEQLDLSFKISGRVEEMLVGVGDHVKKGQKIARIDKGTLDSQLAESQSDVKVQKETLADMKERDDVYNGDQKDAQRALVHKAESSVSEIMDQMKELVIYSPIDGTIIKKGVEVGETIVANSAAGNAPVVTIARDGELEVETNVPESDIVKVAVGQGADVTLDAFTSGDIFSASVTEIEPASTVIQDVVYYVVKLKFQNPDPQFKNGMSADIDIKTDKRDNVVFIPERAIKEEGGKKYVEILKDEKTNVIERVCVTTGLRGDEGMIEIASGLAGGEKVITLTKTP